MRKKLFNYGNVIGILLLLAAGCKPANPAVDNGQQNTETVQQVKAEIDSIYQHDGTDSGKLADLRNLYLEFPQDDREEIYPLIFTKLFFGAYRHPDRDVLRFFEKQGADSNNPERVRIDAYFKSAAYLLYINQEADSGLSYLKKALAIPYPFNDTLYKSYYTLYAQGLMQKGSFPDAARYYVKAIELVEKLNDSASLIGNIGNLANVYSLMGENHKAIPLKLKSLHFFERKRDSASMIVGYVSVGSSYSDMNKSDSAFYYFEKALNLLNAGVQNPSIAMILYNNLGEIYTNRGENRKAREYFDLNKPIVQAIGSEKHNQLFTIFSTRAYSKVRDVTEDIRRIKQYSEDFLRSGSLNDARRGFYTLYRFAEQNGQVQEALRYYLRFDSITNQLTSRTNSLGIAELRTKYDIKKKELKIETQEKQIAQQNSFNHLLLLVLVLLVFLIIFVGTKSAWDRRKKEVYLQRKFTQRLLEKTEQERNRIARDLHDGLSQDLLLLKNQIHQITPAKIDAVINEVRAISRNIHPAMLEQIGLKSSIISICEQIMQAEKLFITAEIQYSRRLTKQKELQLFRIVQEALNNILKYANASAGKVNIFETGDKLTVIIKDNGQGFDVEAALLSKNSFGLLSIMERSKVLNGKATIESSEEGTIIHIEIPIDHSEAGGPVNQFSKG